MELMTDILAIVGWAFLGCGIGVKLYGEKSEHYSLIPELFILSFGLIAASLVLG